MSSRTLRILIGMFACIAIVGVCRPASAVDLSLLTITNKQDKTAPSTTKFQPNQTVWIYFVASDVALDENNRCNLVQNLNILNEKKQVVLSIPKLIEYKEELSPDGSDVVTFHNTLDLQELRNDMGPGNYFAVISVEDKISGKVSTLNVAFEVLGKKQQGAGVRVGQIYFRDDPEGPNKSNNRYLAGQTIWIIVEVENYSMDKQQAAHILEDLYLTDPKGNIILKEEPLISFNDQGEEGVPIVFTNKITLNEPIIPGIYKVRFVVHDTLTNIENERDVKFEILSKL